MEYFTRRGYKSEGDMLIQRLYCIPGYMLTVNGEVAQRPRTL